MLVGRHHTLAEKNLEIPATVALETEGGFWLNGLWEKPKAQMFHSEEKQTQETINSAALGAIRPWGSCWRGDVLGS